jgi:plastocyanin
MRTALLFVLLGATALTAGCGSSDEGTTAGTGEVGGTRGTTGAETTLPSGTATSRLPVAPGTVAIVDFEFLPRQLIVAVGETVTWRNDDPYDHWVVGTEPDVLDTGQLSQAQSHDTRFSQAGTYRYYCNIHNYMKGEVIVR